MASHPTMIKACRLQIISMFYLRGLCSAKDFSHALVLLFAIFVFVGCTPCSVGELDSRFEFEACSPNRNNFDAISPDVVAGEFNSELMSRYSVLGQSLDHICPSDSFCFPSTLAGFSGNEIDEKPKALDASDIQSEDFSSGLKQTIITLRRPLQHGIFKLLDGRNVSCSLYLRDDVNELFLSDPDVKNREGSVASSCISPLCDNKTDKLNLLNSEIVNSGIVDGLSMPPAVIEPSLLDWGHKNIYHPSLAFLTVKNVDKESVLNVYDPYSSNSQFYPCNFSEIVLAPGEVASICFIYLPTQLGLSSAQLVLQTSLGGFLIQAKGFAVESPYMIKPLSGPDVSSSGTWRKNLSLFNPFEDTLYVEGLTAWISTSMGNTSRLSKAFCHTRTVEEPNYSHEFSAEDWLNFGRDDVDLPEIVMRPHKNWEIDGRTTEIIMEVDVSYQFKGKIAGAFCLQLMRASDNKVDTVIVPLEVELMPNLERVHVFAFLEALIPCSIGGNAVIALSIRNNAPYLLSIVKVHEVGGSNETFTIKFSEGLLLFPGTITQVAILDCVHEEIPEVNSKCRIHILTNDTRSSQIEIPCIDVITFCSGHQTDSSLGFTKWINNIDSTRGRENLFSSTMRPPSKFKALNTREADEFVLRNWKSQATSSFTSVLDTEELLFSIVQVGNYGSQWINVKNPSEEPVVMQLILNSGEVVEKCKAPEMVLQQFSSSILLGNKSLAPTRYGFSIAKGAVTETFIHPYGTASLGPILFQPSNRCEWRSSALVRNNLSGVEWLPIRGFGGSISLVLLEGSDPVQSLEFKSNLSTLLNYSASDIVSAVENQVPSCGQALTKEIYAKNMGDLPLEVIRIKVSGSECGLDGFLVHDCKDFSLQPGESVKLHISYRADFTAATIQRDLELALATGILVIPMKASVPLYMLQFCRRSIFWSRLRKAMMFLFFAAGLLCLLVFLLFPRAPALTSQDLNNGESSGSATIPTLNSFHKHINWKISGAISLKLNGFIRSVAKEEPLLLESPSRCSNGHALEDRQEKQNNSLVDDRAQPETRLVSTILSKASSFETSEMQDSSDSRNLRVKVGKEKGRRRKKKKNSCPGVIHFDVSSSQSGNSTPSSPLSPVASTALNRPWPFSPGKERSVGTTEPFSHVPHHQLDKNKCAEPASRVNLLDNVVSLGHGNGKRGLTVQEKPNLTRKVAGRAVLSPSATFPSSGRVVPPWTGHSPFLSSTSTIAPHARAPGTKLHIGKSGGPEDKTGVEDKFTYDIWGNHLFGPVLSYPSKEVTPAFLPPIENNSESFFVRGPQALMAKSPLKSTQGRRRHDYGSECGMLCLVVTVRPGEDEAVLTPSSREMVMGDEDPGGWGWGKDWQSGGRLAINHEYDFPSARV